MPDCEPSNEQKPAPSNRREWARLMNLSVIGMVFPVSMVLGYLGGRWIGGFFEATRVGGMIGALVGIVAGFYNMIKTVLEYSSGTKPDSHDGTS